MTLSVPLVLTVVAIVPIFALIFTARMRAGRRRAALGAELGASPVCVHWQDQLTNADRKSLTALVKLAT
jgi:hypothetical protein